MARQSMGVPPIVVSEEGARSLSQQRIAAAGRTREDAMDRVKELVALGVSEEDAFRLFENLGGESGLGAGDGQRPLAAGRWMGLTPASVIEAEMEENQRIVTSEDAAYADAVRRFRAATQAVRASRVAASRASTATGESQGQGGSGSRTKEQRAMSPVVPSKQYVPWGKGKYSPEPSPSGVGVVVRGDGKAAFYVSGTTLSDVVPEASDVDRMLAEGDPQAALLALEKIGQYRERVGFQSPASRRGFVTFMREKTRQAAQAMSGGLLPAKTEDVQYLQAVIGNLLAADIDWSKPEVGGDDNLVAHVEQAMKKANDLPGADETTPETLTQAVLQDLAERHPNPQQLLWAGQQALRSFRQASGTAIVAHEAEHQIRQAAARSEVGRVAMDSVTAAGMSDTTAWKWLYDNVDIVIDGQKPPDAQEAMRMLFDVAGQTALANDGQLYLDQAIAQMELAGGVYTPESMAMIEKAILYAVAGNVTKQVATRKGVPPEIVEEAKRFASGLINQSPESGYEGSPLQAQIRDYLQPMVTQGLLRQQQAEYAAAQKRREEQGVKIQGAINLAKRGIVTSRAWDPTARKHVTISGSAPSVLAIDAAMENFDLEFPDATPEERSSMLDALGELRKKRLAELDASEAEGKAKTRALEADLAGIGFGGMQVAAPAGKGNATTRSAGTSKTLFAPRGKVDAGASQYEQTALLPHEGKAFVRRVLSGQNPGSGVVVAKVTIDGVEKVAVIPLAQPSEGQTWEGTLKEYSPQEAAQRAQASGEYVIFDTPEEAERFKQQFVGKRKK